MSDATSRSRAFRVQIVLAAATIAMLGETELAWSQTAVPPPENPGLVNELGKLLKDPAALLPSFISSPEGADVARPEAAKPDDVKPDDAKSAVEAVPPTKPSSLVVPSLVTGRSVCPASANGGPDCQVGADLLCKTKGYVGGTGIATDSAAKCSARLLIPGRKREPGDCRTESFVTRAWCQ